MNENQEIAVMGSGSWGTALASHLAKLEKNVVVYSRSPKIVENINKNKTNDTHLPDFNTGDLIARHISEFKEPKYLINTVPTQFIKEFYYNHKINLKNVKIINGSKGIELESDDLISRIFFKNFDIDIDNYCVITGPSHAEEVIAGKPTVVVAASTNLNFAKEVQKIFSSKYFRVYTSEDLIGCELGGALKNIIALASGIIAGLDLGDNVNAALLTRGLAEIMRLGEALGGKRLTFAGLSGLGDLFVTCSSDFSRNRKVGKLIASGKTVSQIEREHNFIAEGIYTTRSALDLAKNNNIEMPIVEQIDQILFNGKNPSKALQDLMLRDHRKEFMS